MNTNLLLLFILLTIINVIVQTIKSLATIKCNKTIAAIVNSIGFGFQTVVTVYTLCDLPLFCKATVVAICNLIGVYLVKWIEEISRKDKLWKIECTVPHSIELNELRLKCKELQLIYNYVDIDKYYLFNFYCPTKNDTTRVKEFLNEYSVKYFVSENTSII